MALTKTSILVVVAVLALSSLLGAEAEKKRKCVQPQDKCSLYKDTCCKGKYCTASKDFFRSGKTRCVKHIKDEVSNITYSDMNLLGWEVGAKTAPAVLMLQEWWGINDAIKAMAEHVAQQGYRVLVPDLYNGEVALTAAEAMHLRSQVNFTKASEEFQLAVDYLKETGSPAVAAVGFCMGGGLALCAAQKSDIVAASAYYGFPSAADCQVQDIKVPVEVHIGEADTRLIGSAPATIALMEDAGVTVDYFTYPGMPHAFMNLITPEGRADMMASGNLESATDLPSEKEAKLGFQRLLMFLRAHLGKMR